ncbi:outer membrane beta-barrel protein [Algoriphagus chordae]|uniref:Outer membrane protein beta-barrel domain-containing protein n=1 Tax=Algoriphagus chordae TaxID=237019 RepID=A0A2W7QVC7_9BACT|nr:outer membrane beta-barrel protein [Algoriphagus chordae]PZX51931.1 Outer membrane protein beta-barrel domain-containing protein [Algoriphagus chordae]
MKKSIILVALLVMFFAGATQAQTSIFSINYSVSIPTGNTADYIDQVSGRGIKLEYQRFITRSFAVGGEIGNTTLYKRELDKVYTEGSASLSGVQYRYQNSYPILVTGTYYANQTGEFKPYASLGVGTIAHDRRIEMGIFSSEDTHWQFALRPELGLMYRPALNVGFKLGAKYYQSFSSSNLDGQSTIGLDFGILFIR